MAQERQEQQRAQLSPAEIGRGLRLLIWDGGLDTVKVTLTTGAFLTGFALWLGASNFWIGFITMLRSLAQAAQLFAPRILETVKSRRRFAWRFYAAGYSAWVLIALLGLLSGNIMAHRTALLALVVLLTLEGALVGIAIPAGVSLVSDIIPPHRRGRFISKQRMVMAAVGIATALAGGWSLDLIGQPGGFTLLYIIGYVCGMGGILCVALLPERPYVPKEKPLNLSLLWLEAWRDHRFRELLIFMTALWASVMSAGPFFAVYMLEDLKLSYWTISVYATLGQLAAMAALPFWGYLSDKFGHTPVLKLSSAAMTIAPFLWIPATAEAYHIIPVAHIFANAVWCGVMLSQFSLLLAVMPEKHNAAYSGVFFGVTGIVAAIAPLFGGILAEAFSGVEAHIGFVHLRDLHFVFIVSACLRMLTLLLLRPKKTEARTTPAKFVLEKVVSANPFRTLVNIIAMQLSYKETERIRATRAVGVSRTKLAVEELIEALNDASPDVRREAARSLGEVGDQRAVEPLLKKLSMSGEGIIDEAARALGRLGDPRAIEPLLRIAVDPHQDVVTRSRVFLALGDLGAAEAVEPALEVLQEGALPLAASAATTLSHIGGPRCIPPILRRLRTSECPVCRRQLAEAAARMIGKDSQINNLFRLDTYAAEARLERIIRRGIRRLKRELPDIVAGINNSFASSVSEKYEQRAYGELIEDMLGLARKAQDVLRSRDGMPSASKVKDTIEMASVLVEALSERERDTEVLEEEAFLAVLAFSAITDALRSIGGRGAKGKVRRAANQ